jgi:hypothetical protein
MKYSQKPLTFRYINEIAESNKELLSCQVADLAYLFYVLDINQDEKLKKTISEILT